MNCKYVYKIFPRFTAFDTDELIKILPQKFSLLKEQDQLMLVIESSAQLNEEKIFYELQRECDRIFFLTGEQLNPIFIYKENPDGSKRVENEINYILHGIEKLPSDIDRQKWQSQLDVQLRLWQLAHLPNTPISVQVILLFQIIESSYPNKNVYPEYKDYKIDPHPRTEAKLIRHWVSHQRPKVDKPQLQNYCKYLGIQEIFFNPTDTNHQRIIPKLYEHVKKEAQKVIDNAITRKQ